MACNISDEGLYEFADRVAGQTVVITGAARGIGREAALEFARRRANLVIGDIDVEGAEKTAMEAKRIGGNSAFQSCDVLVYDDLVSLFQLALLKFGQVDVVIANAGVSEIGRLTDVRLDEQGLPKKPAMKTLEVNLISVLYTTQLAFHYLGDNRNKNSLRTLVLISSLLGFVGLPGAPIYSASKHAVLALMRSLAPEFQMSGLRIAGVFPWFADTAILTASEKDFMTGIPMVPLPRVAGAIFLAATDGAPDTHGGAYTCPDDREVFRISHTEIAENVYELLSNRMKRTRRKMETVQTFLAFASVFARTAAAKLLMGLVFGFVAYLVAHRRNSQ